MTEITNSTTVEFAGVAVNVLGVDENGKPTLNGKPLDYTGTITVPFVLAQQ